MLLVVYDLANKGTGEGHLHLYGYHEIQSIQEKHETRNSFTLIITLQKNECMLRQPTKVTNMVYFFLFEVWFEFIDVCYS